MDILIFGLAGLYSSYILWILYLAVMNLLRVHTLGKLNNGIFILSLPLIIVAYTVDVLFNFIFGTALFLQLPSFKRLTLSARLDHMILTDFGWRRKFAIWFVGTLLQPFDTTGQHTTYNK
jgi:hypothetical protein